MPLQPSVHLFFWQNSDEDNCWTGTQGLKCIGSTSRNIEMYDVTPGGNISNYGIKDSANFGFFSVAETKWEIGSNRGKISKLPRTLSLFEQNLH